MKLFGQDGKDDDDISFVNATSRVMALRTAKKAAMKSKNITLGISLTFV